MQSMTMQGIYKEARSIDAQRTKQYWQMLKRMHGGTDEAVEYIKRTGDDGIWHGTKKEYIEDIAREGLTQGKQRNDLTFGVGQHFGPKEITKHYGDESIRLAKPSELKGTKTLYPDVNKAIVVDLDNPNSLRHVVQHNMHNNQEKVEPLLPKNIIPEGMTDHYQAMKIYEKEIGELLKQDYYKNKYYGKNDKLDYIYTDNGGVGQLHYKDVDVVPPELLRRADGNPMSNRQKTQLALKEQPKGEVYKPSITERVGQIGSTLGLGAVLGKMHNRKGEE